MRKLSAISILLLLAALLVGCGQRTAINPGGPNIPPRSTATAQQPTATAQPTLAATPDVVDTGHPCGSGASSDVRFGDLRVSQVNGLLAYPANELPTNLDPSKPIVLPANLPNPPNPQVNPQPGFGFTVCNTSGSASHVLRGVAVSISSFTAFSGPLNTWQACDGWYQRPNGAVAGGCGGGFVGDEILQAMFDAGATTGAKVSAIVTGTGNAGNNPNGPSVPQLPVKLGPGQMLFFILEVAKMPTAPGTYTLSFSLSYDAVADARFSSSMPALFDSAAVKWTGGNCAKPALLSQIPATDTQHHYVCAPPLG